MNKKFLVLLFLALLVFISCSCLPVLPAKNNAAADEKIVSQQREKLKIISLTREEKIELINDIHRYSVSDLGL